MKSKNNIVRAIKSTDKLIIGMSATEGAGKTTVLKYLLEELKTENFAWLWGECSANSQICLIFQTCLKSF